MSISRHAPRTIFVFCGLWGLLSIGAVHAQTSNAVWQPTGTGDWNVDTNWLSPSGNFVPEGQFQERAVINNGGTAVVSGAVPDPGAVQIGPGTVRVESGGVLTAISDVFADGAALVNNNGTLQIDPGGSFTAESLQSSGTGLLTASGNASITSHGNSALSGITEITGPDVQLTTAGNLTLGGTYRANITGNSHSVFTADQTANLVGTLQLDFQGVTPELGNRWTLVDAATINGRFQNVVTGVSLGPGQRMVVEVADGGTNGRIAELTFGNVLALFVDRDSGAVSIENPAAGNAIDFDIYSIQSPGGNLSPAAWNSLEEQTGGDWLEANPMPTGLSEVRPAGVSTLGQPDRIELGNVFAPAPQEFGTNLDDIQFEYAGLDGQTVQGEVIYSGTRVNNLLLQIDPNDGSARLRNTSPFDVEIDVYAIHSESGALLPDEWDSLEDQNMNWLEANPNDQLLAEVLPAGVQSLTSGQELSLGTVFDTSGEQDVTFSFGFPGRAEPFAGVVLYAPLEDVGGIPGDYSGNGLVEQADLDLVLGNWGADANDVPATWENDPPMGFVDQNELDKVLGNWGSQAPGLAAAAAVPEPATLALLLVGFAACWTLMRRS